MQNPATYTCTGYFGVCVFVCVFVCVCLCVCVCVCVFVCVCVCVYVCVFGSDIITMTVPLVWYHPQPQTPWHQLQMTVHTVAMAQLPDKNEQQQNSIVNTNNR